ncbi:hypothetical protein TRFO_31732 [Tritrichomonas foetus]|uniref:Metallo-beta-lactamase domain-containing protein n=1 Tax=Tritrichomonas foetus TaxID=1144522 RepID=A0A1J4JVZ6_9EUKA|nr:hypothetical protein TRFO_31732 [Tritrichomonas foetus]|eukprot:OHT01461.1 hypothetical protein TRFO_31732 [Tritrichomonas foetus]
MIKSKGNHVSLSSLVLGAFQTNCYIYTRDSHAIIIDPGDGSSEIFNLLSNCDHQNHSNNSIDKHLSIFLTHGHQDHIQAVPSICKKFSNCKIFASPNEKILFKNNENPKNDSHTIFYKNKSKIKPNNTNNLKRINNFKINNNIKNTQDHFQFDHNVIVKQNNQDCHLDEFKNRFIYVKDGEILNCGQSQLQVLVIEGHTPGSVALYSPYDELVFVGDTIFKGNIGDAKSEGSNFWKLIENLKKKILTLPPKTRILPGHGPETTVEYELANNPFLQKK